MLPLVSRRDGSPLVLVGLSGCHRKRKLNQVPPPNTDCHCQLCLHQCLEDSSLSELVVGGNWIRPGKENLLSHLQVLRISNEENTIFRISSYQVELAQVGHRGLSLICRRQDSDRCGRSRRSIQMVVDLLGVVSCEAPSKVKVDYRRKVISTFR